MKKILQPNERFVTKINKTMMPIIAITLVLALGINNHFIQDDAFISFRYAENFAHGHGLIWNIGDAEPVEGYTNFLWTLLMVPAVYLEIDLVIWSKIFGLLFGVGTFIFTFLVSFKITTSKSAALLSIFLLGTNYSFSSYITSGLETQLQAFLFTVSLYISLVLLRFNQNTKKSWMLYLVLSLLFSLAIMTRLDSVLIYAVLLPVLAYSIVTGESKASAKLKNIFFLTIPGALIIIIWLHTKYLYYGDILPNTYYIKAADNTSLNRGISYLSLFFVSYGLLPFFLLGACYIKIAPWHSKPYIMLLIIIILIWVAYTLKVSGDFMEFRFLVPIMPLIYILASIGIFLMPSQKERVASAIFLLCLSMCHAVAFRGRYGIESVSQLKNHITRSQENWKTIGCVLGELFSKANPPVIISTTAAGAIPYYSRLRTIDMLGLNDKWIARNGIVIGTRPGHTRFTTIQYLIDSKVNLVLGHPIVKEISSPATTAPNVFFFGQHDISALPRTSKIIEIPLNLNYRIDVLYITNNISVDNAITNRKLITHAINK